MGDPYRLNVALIPKAEDALKRAVERSGMSRTDVANRALQLYDWVLEQEASGSRLSMVRPSGDVDRVKLL